MKRITLAIVDDDMVSRSSIKKYLENSDRYEIVMEFIDGKGLLNWLRGNSVDVLLCDMRMAEMDGVELMRALHLLYEYIPIVAISSFDDFYYVRGSLRNGAANYLLKHELTREYLESVLDKVCDQYNIHPSENRIYKKRGYVALCRSDFETSKIKTLCEQGILDFEFGKIGIIVISPDIKIKSGVNILEFKQDICKVILDMISQILGDKYSYIANITDSYNIVLLVSFGLERSTLIIINTIHSIASRLYRMSVRMLDTTLYIICSDTYESIESAMEAQESIQKKIEDKFYNGANKIIYDAVTAKIKYKDSEFERTFLDQLEFEIQNNINNVKKTVEEIFYKLEEGRYSQVIVRETTEKILELLRVYKLTDATMFDDAKLRMKYFDLFTQYRELVEDFMKKILTDNKKRYSAAIEAVIAYINNNISEDISLEDCAGIANIGYTVLSREFRAETGMRFVEYLNLQRVNKAKSLLIRGSISMKEVVKKSGFRNYNYFFKVFKDITGGTPSDFLNKKI